MFSEECTICGKGKVVEKEVENHVRYVVGIEMVLPEAIIGTCDTCGAVNYAFRKDVWLKQKMEKGISNYWTPKVEEKYNRLLADCLTFAERHIIMTLFDQVKYDQRTREGRRGRAQARLRLGTATDENLEEMAKLAVILDEEENAGTVAGKLENLKERRAEIVKRGIKRRDLECQRKRKNT